MYRDGHYDDMINGGDWFIGFAVVILVLLIVTVAGVLLSVSLHGSRTAHPVGPAPGPGDQARAVLDGRLARGEITAEEYQSVRAVLDGR